LCVASLIIQGSDTNYFKLKSSNLNLYKYVEIDFPPAIDKKNKIIQKNKQLQQLLKQQTNRCNHSDIYDYEDYILVGCDLRDLAQLSAQCTLAGVDYAAPTLFLSECVLIYMQPIHSTAVIQWTTKEFSAGSLFVSYEQIHPNDAFGQTMIANLNERGCSLLGLQEYPDINAQRLRYISNGYTHYSGW
jgi:tRNA wybutosine-synthesizing protein 4